MPTVSKTHTPSSDTRASEQAGFKPGTLVLEGRFRVLELLGGGGMGLVYLAEQVSLGRQVALKVLRGEVTGQAGMSERFRREALLLSSVDHPAVVRVIDFGYEGPAACLVMEYVQGQTLEQLLRDGPFSLERALRMLEQLAQGLAVIHAKGIVHRDLKPENILVTATPNGEQARLLDFGIARLAQPEESASVTQAGFVLGTPEYMSPEQATGQTLGVHSDIYSFGVVAYRVLSGVLPFQGHTPGELISQHIHQAPRSLLDVAPHLGAYPGVLALVAACLEKLPAKRPATAVALADYLKPAAPLLLTTTPSGRNLTQPAPFRVQRWQWTAAAVVLCALAAVTLVFRSDPERTARRLVDAGRGSEALQVIEDSGELKQQWSMKMLRATALHQVGRHGEELEVMKAVPPGTHFEPLALEALADDYSRKETPVLRKVLADLPKATALPGLQALAKSGPSKGQWGALRFIDLEYAGQGLPLAKLYVEALESNDCNVRDVAAKRLGELRSAEAVGALKKLKELPRKKGFFTDEDCGHDAAEQALKRLEKELSR
jgi:serine/threonine protein kinase